MKHFYSKWILLEKLIVRECAAPKAGVARQPAQEQLFQTSLPSNTLLSLNYLPPGV